MFIFRRQYQYLMPTSPISSFLPHLLFLATSAPEIFTGNYSLLAPEAEEFQLHPLGSI
jgi:hypothetical protein